MSIKRLNQKNFGCVVILTETLFRQKLATKSQNNFLFSKSIIFPY